MKTDLFSIQTDPREFISALKAGTVVPPLAITGLAKKSEGKTEAILFSPSEDCAQPWISVPASMVRAVQVLERVACDDHFHVRIRMTFCEPSNSEAKVLAMLLQETLTHERTGEFNSLYRMAAQRDRVCMRGQEIDCEVIDQTSNGGRILGNCRATGRKCKPGQSDPNVPN